LIEIEYSTGTIWKKRRGIADRLKTESDFIKTDKIDKISTNDLDLLFEYYDSVFFNGWFRDNFKGLILFELSRRMTKSAGITKCPKNKELIKPHLLTITICMGVDFFFKFDHISGTKEVCGIDTDNSLEALLLIFEHELLHAVEFIIYGRSDCSKPRFKDTAKKLFGHTQSHHRLPTNKQIAKEKFGLTVGKKVSFMYEDRKVTGFISNINKRATVMVPDLEGDHVDDKGNRYIKFLVPLSWLSKA
jgi:hypothetical protein